MSDESIELDELEPTEKKKGGLMGVVAALVFAGGGAFAGIQFVGPMVGEMLASESSATAGGDGASGDYESEGEDSGATQVHMIDNLIVNPAGSNATRFLIASIALAPGSGRSTEDLAARDIELRDALLRLLGSKTVEDLSDISKRDALTEEMLATIDTRLGEGVVRRVYLPQFMIQ